MKNIRSVLFLLIILLFSVSKAEVYVAESIEEINNTILKLLSKRSPEKTLLIMPLEEFIIKPVDKEFYINDKKYSAILQRTEKKARLSRKAYLEELILTEYEHTLADPYVVKFIQNIQKLHVPMLVFTTNCSGSFNKIDYLEVWTWTYLLDKNIDLSKSPIGSNQIIFNEYGKKVKGSYPTYYKGLLSANSWNGENSVQSLLAALLAEKLKYLPDVVYVINEKESFIKSIEEQFKSLRRDIQVEGFIFSPSKKVNSQLAPKTVEDFWTRLINKLNKVSRKERNIDEENPYEQ
jgi:chorismate mutase